MTSLGSIPSEWFRFCAKENSLYNCEDISTYFINCSNLNEDYDCVNKPIVFELEKR